MFDIDLIETAVMEIRTINVSAMSVEHCGLALVAESMLDLCRPITNNSPNERIAAQREFNRTMALMAKDADRSTSDSLQELALQAIHRVSTAQQTGDADAMKEAEKRLEKIINFFADLAKNVTRNAFYRHEECERMQVPAADAHVTGLDGAIGSFETRSKYSGWMNYSVESTTMKEATIEQVAFLASVIGGLLPRASASLQSFFVNTVPVAISHENELTVKELLSAYTAAREETAPKKAAALRAVAKQLYTEFARTVLPEAVVISSPVQVTVDKKPALQLTTVHVQLGYRKDVNTQEYSNFYSVQDTWNDLQANRKTAEPVMSAKDAASAFKL